MTGLHHLALTLHVSIHLLKKLRLVKRILIADTNYKTVVESLLPQD